MRPRALLCLTSLLFFAVIAAVRAQPPQLAALPEAAVPPLRLAVTAGDTMMGLLSAAGIGAAEAQDAVDALRKVWDPRELKIGQQITARLGAGRLVSLRFAAGLDRDIVLAREDDHFTAWLAPRPLQHAPQLVAGIIRTSLFEAATAAAVPPSILAEMIRAFSYDVDFQREVQPDDSFEVLYEQLYDEDGAPVGTGEMLYAALSLSGRSLSLYRYAAAATEPAAFFTAAGESVKKALLRTPIDGARLTSGFGLRHHPILGYTKMHRGVDFAAPPGTPIMAAGDGIVLSAGRSGSYGNLVVLRHGGAYETAYGHLSRFVRGLHPGQRVHQGEVVGFVGATGRATGPHLHYEVRRAGAATNPLAVRLDPGARLSGADLARFHAALAATDRQVFALRAQSIAALAPVLRWRE